jgi:hypothetical protein
MTIRKIKLTVGNKPLRTDCVTHSHPYFDRKPYRIPSYSLTVSGLDDQGKPKTRTFEVFRFGVKRTDPNTPGKIWGLARAQVHPIKKWMPNYGPHSPIPGVPTSEQPERGAWDVLNEKVLIHDGPDDPTRLGLVYATIGCIEICGMQGFSDFNEFIVSLSGSKKPTRAAKLAEIGASRQMTIQFLKAVPPPGPVVVVAKPPQQVDAETP